jgi:hypothetical protein
MSRVISGIMVIYGGTGLRLFLDDRKGQNCKSWRSLKDSRTQALKDSRTQALKHSSTQSTQGLKAFKDSSVHRRLKREYGG